MISDFQRIPNIVACQYLDEHIVNRIDKMIGKWLDRPTLADAHRQALQAANAEFHAYEEWLCQQSYKVIPLPYDEDYDEDVPW